MLLKIIYTNTTTNIDENGKKQCIITRYNEDLLESIR